MRKGMLNEMQKKTNELVAHMDKLLKKHVNTEKRMVDVKVSINRMK